MPIGQDEDIRIYELPEAQELTAGMKVAVDSETDGTKSFDITTAMSEKVEEFVAEYNVTSYEDIDAAYKAGKSVICKYQPSPQGNPEQVYYLRSMQYIPFVGYMFGTITSILGFEFIVCRKNNDTTVWSVSHDNALKSPDSGEANGKILSTNGTNTLWIDPPEGVYVLNYSETNQLTDIDIPRAKSQPTYIRIDEGYGDVTIDIPYNNGSTTVQTNYTVVLKVGTTLKLSYIKDGNNEFVFTTIYEDGFYGGGPIGSYGTLFPMLYIRNDNGGLYKWFKVSGELNNGSLNGGMPVPFTKYYHNSRGNGSLASDRNAVEMQFQWDGNIRKQCLLPGEIINHDFSNDSTPEQIQFMGWGATSNRAGYKTISEVPASTAQDEGKVLTVDTNGAAAWTEPPTEIAVFDANYSAPPVPFANYPTFAELNDARLAGKVPIIVQITSTGEHIYYMPTLINVDENQVKFHFVNPETGVILKLEGPTSNPVWSSTTVVGISSYGTRTESGIVDGVLTIYGGNSLTKLKLTTVQSITVKANEGTPNFALEIDNTANSNDVTVTVVDFADTTLNSSVSGGSTVGAGKYVQLTCVGNCWTLAEFANPS